MTKLIAIYGANATGKTTRVTNFLEGLDIEPVNVPYHFTKKGKDRVTNLKMYGDILVIRSDSNFGAVGSTKMIFEMLEGVKHSARIVLVEGFYHSGLDTLNQAKLGEVFDDVEVFFLYYDSWEEYQQRCFERNGTVWESPKDSGGWQKSKNFPGWHKRFGGTRIDHNETGGNWLKEAVLGGEYEV